MTGAARQQLIAQARGGDPAALARLLAQCRPDARRYALRHCVVSDIDDAVREALLIVARHLGALKSVAAFAGWLFTIVRRECGRLARRIVRHETLDDRIADELTQRPRAELRRDLAAALESLPASYLEIIILRDFEELTINEICDRLGITVQAAKARLHRARRLVREYLVGRDDATVPE